MYLESHVCPGQFVGHSFCILVGPLYKIAGIGDKQLSETGYILEAILFIHDILSSFEKFTLWDLLKRMQMEGMFKVIFDNLFVYFSYLLFTESVEQ